MPEAGCAATDSQDAAHATRAAADSATAFSGWFDARGQYPVRAPERRQEPCGVTHLEAPGLRIQVDSAHVDSALTDSSVTVCTGAVRRPGSEEIMSARDIADEVGRIGSAAWSNLRGRFSIIHVELRSRTATFVTDRFAVHPICCRRLGDKEIFFADRADAIRPTRTPELDEQAIFNYFYFHVIPSPRTIFRDVFRLEPSQVVRFDASGLEKAFWWQPRFESRDGARLATLKSRFLDLLEQAVEREVTTERIGSFLSGGTDSSTVAGFLCRLTGRKARTFSIGFDAEGYDEMSYARIAAHHFGTEQHEYYLTPDDLVRSIPAVAAHYDQPFGNSSALPAYYCALRAKEAGIEKLLAGDGGDELFGGNSRYAKQKVFDLYWRVPRVLRERVFEAMLLGQNWPRRLPLLSKTASYVEQARVPMPERMETYNLLGRIGAAAVFTDRLLARVQEREPVSLQSEVYGRPEAASLVDRMLAYDWRFTLADNDLPKVIGTSRLAGEIVGFPLLDDDLVDFSLQLAPELKVRGLTLRFFFKEALKQFLPAEIIRKRKHGFGLPFGSWLGRHEPLRRLANEALGRVAARGIIRPELVGELLSTAMPKHAGYFGEMIWILMMLEYWLDAHAPQYGV
jgi:asparagine synthase (glutamine-hydrolysing)